MSYCCVIEEGGCLWSYYYISNTERGCDIDVCYYEWIREGGKADAGNT
jgi:hypothetical protein